jgi:hypothetical protein
MDLSENGRHPEPKHPLDWQVVAAALGFGLVVVLAIVAAALWP